MPGKESLFRCEDDRGGLNCAFVSKTALSLCLSPDHMAKEPVEDTDPSTLSFAMVGGTFYLGSPGLLIWHCSHEVFPGNPRNPKARFSKDTLLSLGILCGVIILRLKTVLDPELGCGSVDRVPAQHT